jgi:hypothetical protein
MKVTIYFSGGGPLDGSASLERDIKAGGNPWYSFEEMVIYWAGMDSDFRYNIGDRIRVPSPGQLERRVVREKTVPFSVWFEYEITERVEENEELLLETKFIGQKTDISGSPPC